MQNQATPLPGQNEILWNDQAERDLLNHFVDMPDLFVNSSEAKVEESSTSASETKNERQKRKAKRTKKCKAEKKQKNLSSSKDSKVEAAYEVPDKELREAAAREVAERIRHLHPDTGSKRRRTPFMTLEEKEKYSKERNRDHARLTRMRKKVYIDKLKMLAEELTAQKEREENEAKILEARLSEQRAIMRRVVAQLMELRVRLVRDRLQWAKILDEAFTFTQPITPYQSFNRSEIMNSSRVLFGIDATIRDTASFGVMVHSIGIGTSKWRDNQLKGEPVRVVTSIDEAGVLLKGDMLMCTFELRTENAIESGAFCECYQQGMMQCKFTSENKLVSVDMVFDVMSFMQQLQRASGPYAQMPIVPNTFEMANLKESRGARVLMKSEHPFLVMEVNSPWEQMMGFTDADTKGIATLEILQGPLTDPQAMQYLFQSMALQCAAGINLVCHTKNQNGILVYVRIYPLTSDSNLVTHFLGTFELLTDDVSDLHDDEGEGALLLKGLQQTNRSLSMNSGLSDDGYSSSLWLHPGMPHLGTSPTPSVLAAMMSDNSSGHGGNSSGDAAGRVNLKLCHSKARANSCTSSVVSVAPQSVQLQMGAQVSVPHQTMLLHHLQPSIAAHALGAVQQPTKIANAPISPAVVAQPAATPASIFTGAQFQTAQVQVPHSTSGATLNHPFVQPSWPAQLALLPNTAGNPNWVHSSLPAAAMHALMPSTNSQAALMGYQWAAPHFSSNVTQSEPHS